MALTPYRVKLRQMFPIQNPLQTAPHARDDLTAWIRLHFQPELGPVRTHQILSRFGSPDELFKASADTLGARLPHTLVAKLLKPVETKHAQLIEKTLHWASRPGHRLLTHADADYPELLRQMPDAPILLFALGELARLRHPGIAIVGSRHATADGLDHAKNFASYLSGQGLCVVSGLAYGIDGAAHSGALSTKAGAGGTIAVLGTGIDIIYPTAHTKLASDILEHQGLLLSEFGPGTPAVASHFPRRNRIVAGLSRGVLVIEAALKSGSLITARLANEMGREVFAIPGSIHAPLSRGPHALIQQGAKLVETGSDILSELGAIEQAPETGGEKASPPASRLAPPLSPLWRAIGYDSVTEETLLRRTGMLPSILQTELLSLELSGHIKRKPDGMFMRTRSSLT